MSEFGMGTYFGSFPVGNTGLHDWIACNAYDADQDTDTGSCADPELETCIECANQGQVWTPDPDDDQTRCMTTNAGVCFWVIHYNEFLTPQTDDLNPPNFQNFISDISVDLTSPSYITNTNALTITLDKTVPFIPED